MRYAKGLRPKTKEELEEENRKLKAENTLLKDRMSAGRFFTQKELEEHDRLVAKNNRKNNFASVNKYVWDLHKIANQKDREYFDTMREELLNDLPQNVFAKMAAGFLQIMQDVMVERYGWKEPANNNWADKRYKIVQTDTDIMDRVNEVANWPEEDLFSWCAKSAKKRGVLFGLKEEDE